MSTYKIYGGSALSAPGSVAYTVGNTRSCGLKLRHNASSTNKECHLYFNRISCLRNLLPIIDLNLPINLIKSKINS